MGISSRYYFQKQNKADGLSILLMHNHIKESQKKGLTDPIYLSLGEALEDGVSVALSKEEAEALSKELMKFVDFYKEIDNE